MTNVPVKTSLETVFIRILEEWGMMSVDPIEEGGKENLFSLETSFYLGTIVFRGVVKGTHTVICQRSFLEVLATNLLGTDEEVSEEECIDALKEFVNVLTGNCLTESYGEDTVFALTAPRVTVLNPEQGILVARTCEYVLRGDDEPVGFTFKLDVA